MIGVPEIDLNALARLIAARLDPNALLDAEDVGAILKCSARYVLEQYQPVPGFPKAIRLTGPEGRKSNPKWRRTDIDAWINSHTQGRTKRGGRPRNSTNIPGLDS